MPSDQMFWESRWMPSYPTRRTSTGSSLSDLQGPISSPSAPGRCCSLPVVLRVPGHGHGHRSVDSSENIDPVVGGASWSGACGVFSGGSPHVRPSSRRHVSFADGVTMLGDAELPVCSPKAESPPLILPVVVEDSSVTPVEELIELVPSAMGSSLPPPPGFSPFVWPVNDWGLDVDELCSRIGVDCSPSLSQGVGVLVSQIVDGSSDVAPAVGHAGLPLRSVDNSCVQDMLWAPAAPQDTRANDDREIPVPRWLGRVRSSRSARRSPSVPWGPGAHSDIQLIAPQTTQCQWGTMAYPCTTRGSSNGSGSPSRPDLSKLVVPSGSTNSRPLWWQFIYNTTLV